MSCPILERGGAEVCILEKSVSVQPSEKRFGFGGVSSLLCFVGAFYASVQGELL